MAMKRTTYLFLVVLCEIWNKSYSTVILDKTDLQDMCYVNGEVIVSPAEVKNSSGLYCINYNF